MDSIQPPIKRLLKLGVLPPESNCDPQHLNEWQATLEAVATPVSRSEAKVLCSLFGEDDCFGLAWSLLHKVETNEELSEDDLYAMQRNEWIDLLIRRQANADTP
jgi:hypothetical protein